MFSIKYEQDSSYKEYIVFVESLKSSDDSKISYYVRTGRNYGDKFILNIYKNKYSKENINLNIYSGYKYGDFIKIKGKISIPKKLNNPGEFNYKLYLYSNNIYGIINTYSSIDKIDGKLGLKDSIIKKINNFRIKAENIIKSNMLNQESEVTKAIVYGDKEELDEDLKINFNNIGISHLMSVSGTHVVSFMIIINSILRNKKEKKNIIKSILSILFILLFMIYTGFSLSCMRACIMTIIHIISKYLNLKNSTLKSLKISFVLILIYSPFSIFSIGFQLSFASVIGIILFKKNLEGIFKKFRMKNKVINKVLSFIYSSISITLSVNIMILPLQISNFNKVSFPFIIPNLVMSILTIPIRVLGMIGIIISFLPRISGNIFFILNIFVKIFLKSVNIFNKFSFNIYSKSLPPMFFACYYITVIVVYFSLKLSHIITNKKNHNNKLKYNLKNLNKYLKIISVLGIIIVVSYAIFLNIYSKYYSKYVYFFNVEQGEMSYIKYGQSSVIVDMGSLNSKLPFNVINSYFKSENIDYVDVLILSHMDTDHISGVEEFLKEFKVGMVIFTEQKESKNYESFKKMIKESKVNYKEILARYKINIKDIKIDFLLPDNNYIKKDSVNANSIVCTISTNKTSILYTGDINKEAEEKFLKKYNSIKNIDILKVAHHGSKSASLDEFIENISPKYGVISALKKYYGHPHDETIDTLKKHNVYPLLTEELGAIKFKLD